MHRKHRNETERLPTFVQCPGCSYDFVTGEGIRNCSWYECPYLPEDYKVFCPECNYNFATGEGNPRCDDPPVCDWAVVGYEHAVRALERFGSTFEGDRHVG
jgi:hypothetical protein